MILNKIYSYIAKGILIILLACSTISGKGQTDSLTSNISKYSVKEDKVEKIDFRIPSKGKIEEYKTDKRFQYFKEKKKDNPASIFERVKRWLGDKLLSGLHKVTSSGASGWIFATILIVIIVFLIIKLAKINVKAMFGKKKIDAPDIEIYSEDVNEMNFEILIKNALNNKNYRLAVRFLYLRNLKSLSDKGMISWKANKTNYSYQSEINNTALRNQFLDTTLIFDYVWYGEFPLDEYQFSQIHNRMDNFNKTIDNER